MKYINNHGFVKEDNSTVILACAVVYLPLTAVVMTSILLFTGEALTPGISQFIIVAATAITLGPALLKVGPLPVGSVLLALLLMFACASQFIDTSYDGQEYHSDAVYALVHGWNPFYDSYGTVIAPGATALPWPQHYPVGSWLLMALGSSAGLNQETTKGWLYLPVLISPLIWWAPLRASGIPRSTSLLLVLAITASPILAAQYPTRMNDGMLGGLATNFAGFACQAIIARSRVALMAACASLALAIDIKFNALPMFGMLAAAWCLVAIALRGRRVAVVTGAALATTTLLTIATIGFHPYVTNTLEHGQPFYPVLAAPELEINSALVPLGLKGVSPTAQLARSILSPSGGDGSSLKLPFWISSWEVAGVGIPDNMVGGFGPLFSGSLVLALLIAIALPFSRPLSNLSIILVALASGCVISTWATPYSWWPRFVPQLWLVPVFLAVSAINARLFQLRLLGLACAATLTTNSAIVTYASTISGIERTAKVKGEIAEARQASGGYCANFGAAHARITLLREAGVTVFPLQFSLPATCPGAKLLPEAITFGSIPAQSCPCNTVPHDPTGVWVVPPDTTIEDVRKLHQEADSVAGH